VCKGKSVRAWVQKRRAKVATEGRERVWMAHILCQAKRLRVPKQPNSGTGHFLSAKERRAIECISNSVQPPSLGQLEIAEWEYRHLAIACSRSNVSRLCLKDVLQFASRTFTHTCL